MSLSYFRYASRQPQSDEDSRCITREGRQWSENPIPSGKISRTRRNTMKLGAASALNTVCKDDTFCILPVASSIVHKMLTHSSSEMAGSCTCAGDISRGWPNPETETSVKHSPSHTSSFSQLCCRQPDTHRGTLSDHLITGSIRSLMNQKLSS